MIPGNTKSSTAVPAAFIEPNDRERPDLLVDYELGGQGIGDASTGMDVRVWRAEYSGTAINIAPESGGVGTSVEVGVGVSEIALSFDQLMRPVLAYMRGGICYLYWYNSLSGSFETTAFNGATSPRLTFDDTRPQRSQDSDVLFFYLSGGALCYRQQRDRYTVERALINAPAATISKVGMTVGGRMQVVFETSDLELTSAGLVFDRTTPGSALTQTQVFTQAVHARRDDGNLYMVDSWTGDIMQWDGDSNNRLPFEWTSKVFILPKPTNFSFAQVILDDISAEADAAVQDTINANIANWLLPCASGAFGDIEVDAYPVGGSCIEPVPEIDPVYTTLCVFADAELVASYNVMSEKLYRLPSGFRASRWQVTVTGTKGVRRVVLATSAAEIAAV